MKLAELEAKAKALVGTQHWRGLDPEAVLEALDEVERLRVKHTKIHAAIVDARACYIHARGQRLSVIAQIDEILVKALKEIEE